MRSARLSCAAPVPGTARPWTALEAEGDGKLDGRGEAVGDGASVGEGEGVGVGEADVDSVIHSEMLLVVPLRFTVTRKWVREPVANCDSTSSGMVASMVVSGAAFQEPDRNGGSHARECPLPPGDEFAATE